MAWIPKCKRKNLTIKIANQNHDQHALLFELIQIKCPQIWSKQKNVNLLKDLLKAYEVDNKSQKNTQ